MKEVLAELNTSVAVNTEATKGLREFLERELTGIKEFFDRELNRHADDRRGLDSRVSVVETRVDNIDIAMAGRATIDDRVSRIGVATERLQVRTDKVEQRLDRNDGWSSGVKWLVGITLSISVPCAGWVLESVLSKLFGM